MTGNDPFGIPAGTRHVISGWDEGVRMMVGGKRKAHDPARILGYGGGAGGVILPTPHWCSRSNCPAYAGVAAPESPTGARQGAQFCLTWRGAGRRGPVRLPGSHRKPPQAHSSARARAGGLGNPTCRAPHAKACHPRLCSLHWVLGPRRYDGLKRRWLAYGRQLPQPPITTTALSQAAHSIVSPGAGRIQNPRLPPPHLPGPAFRPRLPCTSAALGTGPRRYDGPKRLCFIRLASASAADHHRRPVSSSHLIVIPAQAGIQNSTPAAAPPARTGIPPRLLQLSATLVSARAAGGYRASMRLSESGAARMVARRARPRPLPTSARDLSP